MAYRPKHFKVHCSIQNHVKTLGVFDDDALLAMYVRIGILAIERFADRHDDSFLVSARDLERLAGCRGVANARRKLGRLEANSPLTVCQEGAGYRLTIPNLRKKQGFQSEVVLKRTSSPTPTTTPTPTPTPNRKTPESVSAPPKEPPKPKPSKTLCPERLDPEDRESLLAWARTKDFNESEVRWAFNAVKDWSQSKGERRVNWVAAVRNAMRDGWGLKGYRETDSERYAREMASSPFSLLAGGKPDV